MEDKEQKIKLTFETNADETGKKVEELNKNLDTTTKETDKVSDSQKKASKSTSGLNDSIKSLAPGTAGAVSGFKAMLVQMWALVANPIGAVIAAIAGVFAVLYATLSKFDPVMDAIEQGFNAIVAVFNTLLDGVLSLVTGAKSLGDVFGNLGSDIKSAANEAIEFTKIQQELDDLIIKSTVNQSKYNRQINELILQSKDRTKTEAERIALIDKALSIEEIAFNERKKIADEELKIAQNTIISSANLNKQQQKALIDELRRLL